MIPARPRFSLEPQACRRHNSFLCLPCSEAKAVVVWFTLVGYYVDYLMR